MSEHVVLVPISRGIHVSVYSQKVCIDSYISHCQDSGYPVLALPLAHILHELALAMIATVIISLQFSAAGS